MVRWRDERAVTVQLGAVLLLAILVAALSLYQVNAVPEQNRDSEFAHHERVAGELVELRDAVRGVDSRYERGVPITLGTQYQTRAIAINPPSPTGRIRTSDPLPISIENASVDDETVRDILENPPGTRFIEYEPGYNEYDAPRTIIEHTLLYNDFGHASITLEEQAMIGEDTVTLLFVDGDLSRSSSGTVSVSVETIGGPTAERTLESNGDGNVTITLPTRSPERWEAAIGTSFGEETGQANARVIPNADPTDRENVTIELADREYTLRMARVSVGPGAEKDERFDDARADTEGSESGSGSGSESEPGSGDIEDGTVFAVAQEQLINNKRLNSSFTLVTNEETYDVRVELDDQAGGGSAGSGGHGWQTKRVFIGEDILELEADAADDIGVNLVERDLLDEGAYAGGDTSVLESIRGQVDGSSKIRDEAHDGNVELVVTIDEQ